MIFISPILKSARSVTHSNRSANPRHMKRNKYRLQVSFQFFFPDTTASNAFFQTSFLCKDYLVGLVGRNISIVDQQFGKATVVSRWWSGENEMFHCGHVEVYLCFLTLIDIFSNVVIFTWHIFKKMVGLKHVRLH